MEIKEKFIKKFQKAKDEWNDFRTDFRDVYRFAFPGGKCMFDESAGKEKDIYDGSLSTAVARRVKKTHSALFPPFKEFLDFDPEDAALADSFKDEWDTLYALAKRKVHRALMASNFHTEIDLALGDGFAAFGCLSLRRGTSAHPLIFEAIHPACIFPGRAFEGIVREVFREQKIPGCEVKEYWPEATGIEQYSEKTDDVIVKDGFLYDLQERKFEYVVLVNDDIVMDVKGLKSAEMFVFRTAGKTGSSVGYSDCLRVLPEIRSADETRYLLLGKARFDLYGLWAAEDESVINVDDLKRVEPGSWIFFRRGATLPRPLYNGTGFDLSQMVLNDLHMQIREAIEGPTLPAENSGSRRSAYEYQLRQGEIEDIELPGYLRLLLELQPLFEKVVEILTDPDMADSPYYIDLPDIDIQTDKGESEKKKLTISPISPMIRKQDESDNQRSLQAYTLANQINPEITAQIVNVEDYLRKFLDDSGFPSECMFSKKETKKMRESDKNEQQAVLQQQAAQEVNPEEMTQAASVVLPQEGFL